MELHDVVDEAAVQEDELLAVLLADEGFSVGQARAIRPRATTDAPPLSFAQQRLWLLDQLVPGNPFYNIPSALRLCGPLDVPALERSLSEIARRHQTLRTTFRPSEGRPVQVVAPAALLTLPVVDLGGLPEVEREAAALRLAREEARRSFDLARGPLLRTTLLRLGAAEHVLLLTTHHIVSDGWSRGVLNRELAAVYGAYAAGRPSPLPEPPIQYADFALWQRQRLRGELLETLLAYWRRQLAGLPPLELPTDRPRPSAQTFRGARHAFVVPDRHVSALTTLGQREGATLFMTLLAAFTALLHRYTGREDIAVGSPIAGRTRPELEGLIGFFANTLALRTDLSGDPTFRELLRRVREVCLGAYAHQELPFERLVEELGPERDLSRNPLVQVLFALQNAPRHPPQLPGLAVTPLEVDAGTAKADLELHLREGAGGLEGTLVYSTDLFDAATAVRLTGHFRTLLEGVAADPERRLSDLPLLTEPERHRLLVEWNATAREYPREACIHQLFEAQVERTPDAVAVISEDRRLTYRELNARANRLAHHLRGLGVGPEVPVGICLERSTDLVVGLLAILKAGGAYLPLDPAYPAERLAVMLADAEAPVVVTQRRLCDRLPDGGARAVCLDADRARIDAEAGHDPARSARPDNLAYVLYTSGSTGRPKGVALEHRGTVAFLEWAGAIFSPADLAGTLASTSICFDLSVFELFLPLSRGGAVILAENALQLPCLPCAGRVTLINTVPSAMAELMQVDGVPRSVRTVNLAGEPLPNPLAQQLYRRETVRRVFNLYGPTEATTYATAAPVTRGALEAPSVGRPIANARVYVLDRHLRPVPVGVPGELHIGGAGLARGYLGRPELTAERFIPDPFGDEPGGRLYKTGDLARYRSDGVIDFLGRLDDQVKIRGFRVEPGEVEATLGQHPAVRQAVVLAREDRPGDKRLTAYVVPRRGRGPAASDLRRFLGERLPGQMVPSAFVVLAALPLTANGKVDRRALPAPEPVRPELESAYAGPRTAVEEVLAGIWAEVLGLERIGIHDDFFDLGGHSLLAARLIARVGDAFHMDLPLRSLFEARTIARVAELVEATILETVAGLSEEAASQLVSGAPGGFRRPDRLPPGPAADPEPFGRGGGTRDPG